MKPLVLWIGTGTALVIGLSSCGVADQGTEEAAPPASRPALSGAPTPAPEDSAVPHPEVSAAPSVPLPAPKGGPVDGVGIFHSATFKTYTDRAVAITYNPELVPVSAPITVMRNLGVDSTTLSLQVGGLQPGQAYSAHVHRDTCGETGEAAGPPYRHVPTATNDPTTTVPGNEMWLDFRTDAQGSAYSTNTVDWTYRPGEGHSLIVHAGQAPAGGTDPGQAGDRIACFVLGRS